MLSHFRPTSVRRHSVTFVMVVMVEMGGSWSIRRKHFGSEEMVKDEKRDLLTFASNGIDQGERGRFRGKLERVEESL